VPRRVTNPQHNKQTPFIVLLLLVLALLVVVLGSQYYSLKRISRSKINELTAVASTQATRDTIEQAQIISTTLTRFFSLSANAELQSYIFLLHEQLDKDITVLNGSKIILADSTPKSVGTLYIGDKREDISQTISDGIARTFVEKNNDLPDGLSQVVLPLRDTTGNIVGAVIVSSDHIHSSLK